MTTSSDFCLACGHVVLPGNKRYLCSEDSPVSFTVYQAWRDLLAERLGSRFVEAEIESMVRGTPPGIVHKKCFGAIKSLHEKKSQLLMNLDGAIAKMPCSATNQLGRKRACPCESNHDEAVKRRRLISDSSRSISATTSGNQSSPGVKAS